jgi:hypothetical protein
LNFKAIKTGTPEITVGADTLLLSNGNNVYNGQTVYSSLKLLASSKNILNGKSKSLKNKVQTLLRTPDKKIFLPKNGSMVHVKTLKELASFKNKKIINISFADQKKYLAKN